MSSKYTKVPNDHSHLVVAMRAVTRGGDDGSSPTTEAKERPSRSSIKGDDKDAARHAWSFGVKGRPSTVGTIGFELVEPALSHSSPLVAQGIPKPLLTPIAQQRQQAMFSPKPSTAPSGSDPVAETYSPPSKLLLSPNAAAPAHLKDRLRLQALYPQSTATKPGTVNYKKGKRTQIQLTGGEYSGSPANVDLSTAQLAPVIQGSTSGSVTTTTTTTMVGAEHDYFKSRMAMTPPEPYSPSLDMDDGPDFTIRRGTPSAASPISTMHRAPTPLGGLMGSRSLTSRGTIGSRQSAMNTTHQSGQLQVHDRQSGLMLAEPPTSIVDYPLYGDTKAFLAAELRFLNDSDKNGRLSVYREAFIQVIAGFRAFGPLLDEIRMAYEDRLKELDELSKIALHGDPSVAMEKEKYLRLQDEALDAMEKGRLQKNILRKRIVDAEQAKRDAVADVSSELQDLRETRAELNEKAYLSSAAVRDLEEMLVNYANTNRDLNERIHQLHKEHAVAQEDNQRIMAGLKDEIQKEKSDHFETRKMLQTDIMNLKYQAKQLEDVHIDPQRFEAMVNHAAKLEESVRLAEKKVNWLDAELKKKDKYEPPIDWSMTAPTAIELHERFPNKTTEDLIRLLAVRMERAQAVERELMTRWGHLLGLTLLTPSRDLPHLPKLVAVSRAWAGSGSPVLTYTANSGQLSSTSGSPTAIPKPRKSITGLLSAATTSASLAAVPAAGTSSKAQLSSALSAAIVEAHSNLVTLLVRHDGDASCTLGYADLLTTVINRKDAPDQWFSVPPAAPPLETRPPFSTNFGNYNSLTPGADPAPDKMSAYRRAAASYTNQRCNPVLGVTAQLVRDLVVGAFVCLTSEGCASVLDAVDFVLARYWERRSFAFKGGMVYPLVATVPTTDIVNTETDKEEAVKPARAKSAALRTALLGLRKGSGPQQGSPSPHSPTASSQPSTHTGTAKGTESPPISDPPSFCHLVATVLHVWAQLAFSDPFLSAMLALLGGGQSPTVSDQAMKGYSQSFVNILRASVGRLLRLQVDRSNEGGGGASAAGVSMNASILAGGFGSALPAPNIPFCPTTTEGAAIASIPNGLTVTDIVHTISNDVLSKTPDQWAQVRIALQEQLAHQYRAMAALYVSVLTTLGYEVPHAAVSKGSPAAASPTQSLPPLSNSAPGPGHHGGTSPASPLALPVALLETLGGSKGHGVSITALPAPESFNVRRFYLQPSDIMGYPTIGEPSDLLMCLHSQFWADCTVMAQCVSSVLNGYSDKAGPPSSTVAPLVPASVASHIGEGVTLNQAVALLQRSNIFAAAGSFGLTSAFTAAADVADAALSSGNALGTLFGSEATAEGFAGSVSVVTPRALLINTGASAGAFDLLATSGTTNAISATAINSTPENKVAASPASPPPLLTPNAVSLSSLPSATRTSTASLVELVVQRLQAVINYGKNSGTANPVDETPNQNPFLVIAAPPTEVAWSVSELLARQIIYGAVCACPSLQEAIGNTKLGHSFVQHSMTLLPKLHCFESDPTPSSLGAPNRNNQSYASLTGGSGLDEVLHLAILVPPSAVANFSATGGANAAGPSGGAAVASGSGSVKSFSISATGAQNVFCDAAVTEAVGDLLALPPSVATPPVEGANPADVLSLPGSVHTSELQPASARHLGKSTAPSLYHILHRYAFTATAFVWSQRGTTTGTEAKKLLHARHLSFVAWRDFKNSLVEYNSFSPLSSAFRDSPPFRTLQHAQIGNSRKSVASVQPLIDSSAAGLSNIIPTQLLVEAIVAHVPLVPQFYNISFELQRAKDKEKKPNGKKSGARHEAMDKEHEHGARTLIASLTEQQAFQQPMILFASV